MYQYIILIFIIGWCIHPVITKLYSYKVANIYFLLIMFPVCLFAMGLRDISVGVDTQDYKKYFDIYINYSWKRVILDNQEDGITEPGLRILMKLCGEIYPNYYFYQVIFSSIYLGLFTKFIYKYTTNVVLTFAIFLGGGLYLQSFNGARQMFATIFIAYAMIYLLDKKYIKSLLLIGIAYFFHLSSLIALIMFIIYPLRNNKYLLVISPILLILSIVYIENYLLILLTNFFEDKYIWYAISDYSRPNKGIFLKILWIINLLLAIFSLIYYQKKQSLNLYALLSLVAVACYWVGLSINYADRVGLLFLPAILMMYDIIGEKINNKTVQLIYYNGFTILYIIYFYYSTYIIQSISYKSIINNM